MSDKELQRALLKERRAAEKCERLKVQCRSQAALMTRLFASKLGEQGELLSEALDRGASSELAGRAAAFRESTAWILGEIEAGGIEGASDAELDALRAENAALVDARDELERRYLSEAMERLKADHKEALKKAKAKARAADGDAVKNAEKEKEQLMSAMEKEVEALIAEERAKFDKERERLEKSAAKAKKSAKGNTKALSALAKQVRALKPQIAAARREARATLAELPAVSKDVAAQILSRVRSTERELAETTRKYKRELGERKRLHNLVQELRGNIRVFCRVRPVSKREREHAGEGMASCVSFPNDGEINVARGVACLRREFCESGARFPRCEAQLRCTHGQTIRHSSSRSDGPSYPRAQVASGRKEKTFEYDQVFNVDSKQADVYEEISGLVTSVLDGYNVCIFAYGQTGSGKTYTMTGPPEDRGCNLRALQDLFAKAADRRGDTDDKIKVSVIEVYNEQIRDLLSDKVGAKKLEVRRGDRGNYVPDLTEVDVRGDDEVLELMAISDRARSMASTDMNEQSSRSHMLMNVTVESFHKATGVTTVGKLHLVDLAGSERPSKSGATGQALKEAQNINKSLSALGDVIAARAQGSAHIPFRNSTLTHLLQDSLSQDSKTLMFCCISPILYNVDETFCTLTFASRVGSVELGKATKQVVGGAAPGKKPQRKSIA
ncbi:hypothetical protein JL722_6524 [Aureococcus anophagefferens]|nr:hypothetical protein JL722_6524 [Aureococcus anophagefferens]